jgi:hypothetical protein
MATRPRISSSEPTGRLVAPAAAGLHRILHPVVNLLRRHRGEEVRTFMVQCDALRCGADCWSARLAGDWQFFCSSAGVTRSPALKCAKKEQFMESQSRDRINSGLSEFSALVPVSIAHKGVGRRRGVAEGLKQLGVENNLRLISQIESMIADFDRTATQLESWILAEQNRTRIHDQASPVYSTSAKAMVQRRDKLRRSTDLLKCKLADMTSAEYHCEMVMSAIK